MAFLKKVFSPGGSKDDEIMYSSQPSQQPDTEASGPYTDGVPTGENAPTLHTDPETKDGGVLRQITNPGGRKYDELGYGETASTDPSATSGTATGAAVPSTLQTQQHTADRDLPTQTTGSKPTGSTLDTPIPSSRLDLDPDTMSQQKYDDQRYDPSTSSTVPGMAASQPQKPELLKDNQSSLSMKSGALGPYAQQTDDRPVGSNTQTLPERSFPLGGGVASENNRPASSVYSDTTRSQPVAPTSTSEYLDPSTTAPASTETSGLGPGSGSAAIAAAGTGAAATTAHEHEHQGHGHNFEGDPCPPGDQPQPTGPHHISGPHSTDMANLLDPHVPGEFPTEDGLDPHQHGGSGLGAPSGVGAGGVTEVINDRNAPSELQSTARVPAQSSYETGTSSVPPTSTTSTMEPEKEHHYGRDAALAGGAGAAGVGVYEVLNDRMGPSSTTQPNSTVPAQSSYETGTSTIPPTASTASSQPQTTSSPYTYEALHDRSAPTSTSEPQKEHPYGREAALAAGAGTAGYGAYEATRPDDRGDTGPASKTIGPHKSNLMNILDPRVQPEPENMKDHDTTGPWQSDTLNKVDPKVTSDPEKAAEKGMGGHGYATFPEQGVQGTEPREGHHYGRDAALAGGAGAAGYGAYEATRGGDEKTLPGSEAGPHPTGTGNVLDPNVSATPAAMKEREPITQQQQQDPEHHYGRDAALVGGGAGAAGAAAYGAHEYDQKEAEKMAKERAKEAEKAQKEHEKEMKKEDKAAEKEHKKEDKAAEKQHEKDAKAAEKEREKEREKHEKAMAHEREKQEKERLKEQDRMEKEHAKEQEKLEKEKAKEDEKLEKARKHQSMVAEHNGHNKLHKDPPEEKEKKPSIIHRILHPKASGDKQHVGEEAGRSSLEGESGRPRGLDYKDADEARHAQNAEILGHDTAGEGEGSSVVRDPHE